MWRGSSERGRGCAAACGNICASNSCRVEASPAAGHSHTTPTGPDAGSGHTQKSCRNDRHLPAQSPRHRTLLLSVPEQGQLRAGAGGARLLAGRSEMAQLRDQLGTERPWRSDAGGEAIDVAVRDEVATLQPNTDRDAAIATIRELRHDF